MRLRVFSLTLAAAGGAAAGCGDDHPSTPDAKVVDSAVTPDTRAPYKHFDADEGGEVRIEYIRFSGGTGVARMLDFLFKDSGSRKFFPFPGNTPGSCTDMTTGMVFPSAYNPIDQQVRMNPGTVLISGGPTTGTLVPRTTSGNDPLARPHPANGWGFNFNGTMAADGATYFNPNQSYDVTFTGSDDMPAQVFDDALFMPNDFTLIAPPAAGAVPFPANTAQTFTFNVPTSNPPPGVDVFSILTLGGPMGPTVFCIEPPDGSITVPANLIDVTRAKYPAGGNIGRALFTHQERELIDKTGPTGKRLDFLAIWCYVTPFSVP